MSRALWFAFLALCCPCLSLTACAASTAREAPADAPTIASTQQAAVAATPTIAADAAFRDELAAVSGNLRGQFIGGPGGEIDPLADVTIVYVFVQLASPSLADAQWDAYAIQRALWTGQEYTIPAGWEVSAQFYVPSTDPNASSMGRYIGVANLHTASARQFDWDQLTPQQAWARYDGVEYSAAGL